MPYSYNGWYASPNLNLRPLVVAGESFVPGVLDDDDVWTVFNYLVNRLHNEVEPIVRSDWHQADDWGYSYRLTTNDDSLSCHASGTAIDYNATRHPFGVDASANFTPAQITEIRQIVNEAGVVVWGGDYRNTPDAMHFEISGTKAEVAAAATRLRNKGEEDIVTPEDIDKIADRVVGKLLSTQIEVKRGGTGDRVRLKLEQVWRETFQRS